MHNKEQESKMRKDPKKLTIDFKKLLSLPVAKRMQLTRTRRGRSWLSSLTPTEYAKLFPSYFRKRLPDMGRSGTATPAGGGGSGGGGSGGGSVGGGSSYSGSSPQTTPYVDQPSRTDSSPTKSQTAAKHPSVAEPAWMKKLEEEAAKNRPAGTTPPVAMSGSLASIRQRQMKELEDPKVRAAVLARAEIEVGGQPKAQQAWIESLFNRAAANKLSLYDATSNTTKHRYYPFKDDATWRSMAGNTEATINNLNKKFSKHLSSVGSGSNITHYATDNASGELGESKHARFGGKWIDGEHFTSDPGVRRKWARNQEKIDRELMKKSPSQGALPQDPRGRHNLQKMSDKTMGVSSEEKLREFSSTVRGYSYESRVKSSGECVKGSQGVLGGLLGDKKTFSKPIGVKAAGSMTLQGGNQYLSKTNYFSSPTLMDKDYLKNPNKWRIGDTVVAQGGGQGLGHIQVWNGKAWVSDFKQNNVLMRGYTDHTLYRLNSSGLSRLNPEYLKEMDSNGATKEYVEENKIPLGSSQVVGSSKEVLPDSNNPPEKSKGFDALNKLPQSFRKEIESLPPEMREKALDNLSYMTEEQLGNFGQYVETLPKQEQKVEVKNIKEGAPLGEIPQAYSQDENYGKLPKAPNNKDLKDQDLEKVFPAGKQRFFYEGGNRLGGKPNSKLIEVLKEASKDLPAGYHVRMFSGHDYRPRTMNHPGRVAIDLAIVDSKGTRLRDRGFGEGHKVYEQLAQSMQIRGQKMFPGTKYIWGGAWKAADGDRMHYQIVDPEHRVPGASTGSGAYSFESGINVQKFWKPDAAKAFMNKKELEEYRQTIENRYDAEQKAKISPVKEGVIPNAQQQGPAGSESLSAKSKVKPENWSKAVTENNAQKGPAGSESLSGKPISLRPLVQESMGPSKNNSDNTTKVEPKTEAPPPIQTEGVIENFFAGGEVPLSEISPQKINEGTILHAPAPGPQAGTAPGPSDDVNRLGNNSNFSAKNEYLVQKEGKLHVIPSQRAQGELVGPRQEEFRADEQEQMVDEKITSSMKSINDSLNTIIGKNGFNRPDSGRNENLAQEHATHNYVTQSYMRAVRQNAYTTYEGTKLSPTYPRGTPLV